AFAPPRDPPGTPGTTAAARMFGSVRQRASKIRCSRTRAAILRRACPAMRRCAARNRRSASGSRLACTPLDRSGDPEEFTERALRALEARAARPRKTRHPRRARERERQRASVLTPPRARGGLQPPPRSESAAKTPLLGVS